MTRREIARKVCRDVMRSLPVGTPEAEVRKALFDAYPFGDRKYSPYKIWLEVQRDTLEEWFPYLREARGMKELAKRGIKTRGQVANYE